MNWDEILANLDSTLSKIDDKLDSNTYSDEDVQIEHNKPEDIETRLKDILSKYQTTKDIQLLEEYLDLLSNVSDQDLKHYLLIQLENGQSVLQEISNYKINIDYTINIQILNDPDLTKVLIQTKNKEAFIFADEETMLMEIDGITVLEHILQNGLFQNYLISKVSSSPLLVELLIKYDKKDCLSSISEEQLFQPFEDGTVLDYLFKNNLVTYSTMGKIVNKTEIYNYIVKYKAFDKLSEISEPLLTQQIEGKYILDLILENNQRPTIYSLRNPELLDLIIQRNKLDLLQNVSTSALLNKLPNQNITLFEFLLDNNIVPNGAIRAIENNTDRDDKFFKIIESKKRYDLIKKPNEAALLKEHNGKNLLDLLIENNVTFELNGISKPETVKMIYDSGRIELLQACKESLLLSTLPNGKTVLQELLDNNLTDLKTNIEDEKIVKYIFDNSLYKLYSRITTPALLRYKDLNTTYLDQVLEEAKINPEINITNLVEDAKWNPKDHAKVRIIYAMHDMHMYLSILTKKDLLEEKNNSRLIDELLEENPQIAVSKVIPARVRQDVEIAMILKLKGLKQEHVKFESITQKIEEEYLTGKRKEYEVLPLTPEQEELLKELSTIMNDGLGEPDLIATLIANYRYLLSINSIYTNEIYHLIAIKQQTPQFTYKHVKDGAYFSSYKKMIGMDDTNIDTLNHETGHALFHYLTEKELPEGFEMLITKLRENPEFLERVAKYSIRFNELKTRIENEVEATFMKQYDESITDEKLKEIQDFIDNLNQREKEKYRSLGYSEDVLDIILGEMYTVEEYIAQDRRIKKQNMVELILRTQHGPFIAIGDFYDGIYKGKFKGGVLLDSQGKKIKPTFGHGIEYYSRGIEWAFDEMIANYSEIIKSSQSELGLQQLKEHIGEELYNILEEYYHKKILQSTKLTQTTQVVL